MILLIHKSDSLTIIISFKSFNFTRKSGAVMADRGVRGVFCGSEGNLRAPAPLPESWRVERSRTTESWQVHF